MAFSLKSVIFSYFGVNAKVMDTYKTGGLSTDDGEILMLDDGVEILSDDSGKGINERYQESLGAGYDDELSDLIDNFIERNLVPQEMLSRLIPHMETMLGGIVVVSDTVAMRRKIIQFAQQIYNIKSTALSYEVLFKLLGFETVVIEEFGAISGFDSDLTFDDEGRTFDGSDRNCSDYSVHLTGSISITQDILDAISRIIAFLEPINADLRMVTYNGEEISIVDLGIFDEFFGPEFE